MDNKNFVIFNCGDSYSAGVELYDETLLGNEFPGYFSKNEITEISTKNYHLVEKHISKSKKIVDQMPHVEMQRVRTEQKNLSYTGQLKNYLPNITVHNHSNGGVSNGWAARELIDHYLIQFNNGSLYNKKVIIFFNTCLLSRFHHYRYDFKVWDTQQLHWPGSDQTEYEKSLLKVTKHKVLYETNYEQIYNWYNDLLKIYYFAKLNNIDLYLIKPPVQPNYLNTESLKYEPDYEESIVSYNNLTNLMRFTNIEYYCKMEDFIYNTEEKVFCLGSHVNKTVHTRVAEQIVETLVKEYQLTTF